ncbi:hypothetical protein VFPFJ_06747 [Purpureocillium lilacinum]|uniref:Uncharacterized protein n=1 Tax=Purpureocillium lilacinum TaxID=33203 RepID=A0A179HE82_PURLI|nr:hypothetical protein VFPFJ_06747 [Purpureocillium lilacinum]OAQ88282.1 hypothetical protein VFPFJ_06747 [Purpureocillium lilacinum]
MLKSLATKPMWQRWSSAPRSPPPPHVVFQSARISPRRSLRSMVFEVYDWRRANQRGTNSYHQFSALARRFSPRPHDDGNLMVRYMLLGLPRGYCNCRASAGALSTLCTWCGSQSARHICTLKAAL